MSEDKFRSEMSYLAALSIAKNLREKGLLSEEEYAVIDTNLRAEFSPSLGTLLSENDLQTVRKLRKALKNCVKSDIINI